MRPGLHVRVDNRLLHGQVVQFWIPYLEVQRLLIADDETAQSPAMSAVFRMAVPQRVDLEVVTISGLKEALEKSTEASTMVLISDVFDLARVIVCGIEIETVVLGNVHSTHGRERVTDSVYLSREELDALVRFTQRGGEVQIQTFPGERMRLEVGPDGVVSWSKH